MVEPSQSKVILIPEGYSPATRVRIAEDILRRIRRRTVDGIDISGRLFSSYSKNYDKTGTVDLSLSGNMIGDLELLSHGPGFIRIGFTDQDSNDKASYIQSPRGQKRGKQPVRKFIGISQKDLNKILENYPR